MFLVYAVNFFGLVACGMIGPQRLNPRSLHWKHGVLTTGLPGKSPRLGSSESSVTIIWGDLLIVTSMSILERLIQQGPVKCILKNTVGQFLTYSQSVP